MADLNLHRSREACTAQKRPPRFQGKLPMNPYFEFFPDGEFGMKWGSEYGGDLAELIAMQDPRYISQEEWLLINNIEL